MKITFIVGLPGSGKTHLGKAMSTKDTIFIDDFQRGKVNFKEMLIESLNQGADIILTDPLLCLKSSQEKALELISEYNYDIEWIFFENNIQKCTNNISYRKINDNDDRKVLITLKHLHSNYYIPNSISTKDIWQPSL
jgi:predicted kinase